MRKTLCLMLLCAGVGLAAQTTVVTSDAAGRLEMSLRDSKTGVLVILDGPKGEWKPKVDALIADPVWIDQDLSYYYYGQKASEIETWIQGKYPLTPRPCWVLFAEKGRPVASGSSTLDASAIAKVAQDAGIKTFISLLREFLRTNPDHLEAQQQLLSRLNWKAATKMKLKLGEKRDPIRPADEKWDYEKFRREQEAELEAKEDAKAKITGVEKPPPDLEAEEDQAIWGEVADRLGDLFRSGDWSLMEAWSVVPREMAERSPRTRDVCLRALPEVEAALARRPESWSLWSVWLGLSKVVGGRPIRPLLDSLTPLPTISATQWPPYMVRDAYIKDARGRNDWQGIKDLLLPQWEIQELWKPLRVDSKWVQQVDGKIQAPVETGSDWRGFTEPLAEALLRLGETHLADRIVTASFTQHPWTGLPKRAQQLALRCNQPSLAAQWGALVPPAK
ncbi:MAG: hypothetical protein IPP78_07925 [Holophagaceae bacterium]|nr:hypothetical protein [Holophagaceae bacterium]